ncbi:MAG: hypothetical protein V3V10_03730 [Planctomycetota bacterium]
MSDRPKIRNLEAVSEDARCLKDNFLLLQGCEEIELAIKACASDIKLHKGESTVRRDLTGKGLEVPKRWQVAPGVFEKIVARMMKLLDRKSTLIERADEIYENHCRSEGWGMDAKKIDPEAEVVIQRPTAPKLVVEPVAVATPDSKNGESVEPFPEINIDEIAQTATAEILKAFGQNENENMFVDINNANSNMHS